MSLYNEYVTEKYIGKNKEKPKAAIEQEKYKKPVFNSDPLKTSKKISQLKHDHPVKKYIESRQIPPAQHYKLYYAPKFIAWINSIVPGKLNDKMKDEPRLILPFKDEFGKVFGVSARGFDPNGMRYITIMFDETRSKIFGLDTVDFTKRYYIVEGALDSLFIENSVAMAGADGNATSFPNIENAVFVFDLEYRNREILSRISRLVEKGHSVCLWPSTLADRGKDINDLIISGLKSQEIEKIIIENTYKGLLATLKIAELRKV